MSLVTKDCFETIKGDFLDPADICFHCGDQLERMPVIMWRGFPSQIWLHVKCARNMAAGLYRDVVENKQGKEIADELHKQIKSGRDNKE